MKTKIAEQKKNPLLKREESWILLEHDGKATPSRAEIIKEAAKALKAKEELVVVDKIFSETGRTASRAKVLTYSRKEDIPKDKLEKFKKRMKLPETPAEEAPKEGAPAEKKEEPKEEAPKEEKSAEEKKE